MNECASTPRRLLAKRSAPQMVVSVRSKSCLSALARECWDGVGGCSVPLSCGRSTTKSCRFGSCKLCPVRRPRASVSLQKNDVRCCRFRVSTTTPIGDEITASVIGSAMLLSSLARPGCVRHWSIRPRGVIGQSVRGGRTMFSLVKLGNSTAG